MEVQILIFDNGITFFNGWFVNIVWPLHLALHVIKLDLIKKQIAVMIVGIK